MTLRHIGRNERGFSLVEMAMVLVVGGIVLAAAIPNIAHYMTKDHVRKSAEKFKHDCQRAQQIAQRTRVPHRIVYDPTWDHYYFESWNHVTSAWELAWADTTELPGAVQIEGGTTADSNNHIITFEPLGTIAMSDCPATIEFSSGTGDSTSVSLVRTGRMVVTHHH